MGGYAQKYLTVNGKDLFLKCQEHLKYEAEQN